jgi:DNA-3-methyladenine glycosylase
MRGRGSSLSQRRTGFSLSKDNVTQLLSQKFFNRPTLRVARELLGKYLVRKQNGKTTAYMITEVEAYNGFSDKASHAHRGMTPRNTIMFGSPGVCYVYFTYGMHWMLNIVTGKKGYPAAVLIRGVEKISGPARVTKALGIDRRLNGKPLRKENSIWIEDRGIIVRASQIKRSPRIGIRYAAEYIEKPWRFYLVTT